MTGPGTALSLLEVAFLATMPDRFTTAEELADAAHEFGLYVWNDAAGEPMIGPRSLVALLSGLRRRSCVLRRRDPTNQWTYAPTPTGRAATPSQGALVSATVQPQGPLSDAGTTTQGDTP